MGGAACQAVRSTGSARAGPTDRCGRCLPCCVDSGETTMIRLVVVDVDGVLSPGEAAPLDFAVLQRLAEFNDRGRHDPTYPAVTLCTGRPAPYVEVLMQAIHGRYPAVYENGAGLYIPEPYGFKWHPAITPATQARLAQ